MYNQILYGIVLSLVFQFITYSQSDINYTPDEKSYDDRLISIKRNPESIYLQTNKDIYERGEELWFKAYVLDGNYLTPSSISKTLYIELENVENNQVFWQEKYEIKDGFVNGQLVLSNTLLPGKYRLIAFSSYSYDKNQKDFYNYNTIEVIETGESLSSRQQRKEMNKGHTDFQMLPEGGHLVAGLRNRLAFKRTWPDGSPASVSGILLENGNQILSFRDFHAGMGSFEFVPKKDSKYQVKLLNGDEEYNLPTIKDQGVVMRLLENNKERLVFRISQNRTSDKKKVYINVSVNGVPYSVVKSILNPSVIVEIPLKDLPQGIAEVTLFDEAYRPICERLVYVNQDRKLYIKTTLSGSGEYSRREMVNVGVKVSDEYGNPVVANLGVSIHDWAYQNSKNQKTIFTHNYLATKLRGVIFNPEYYFNKENADRGKALDLLMLTQGWRKYNWETTDLDTNLLVTDSIQGKVGVKGKKNSQNDFSKIAIMAYIPGKDTNTDLFFSDVNGNFKITPKHLKIGERGYLYIKLMVPSKSKYHIFFKDSTYERIDIAKGKFQFVTLLEPTDGLGNGKTIGHIKNNPNLIKLEEVYIDGKIRKVKRRGYMADLDSIAKLELNTDYVCIKHNYLNCPICIGNSDNKKPVEGEVYQQLEVWDENTRSYVKGRIPTRQGELFRNLDLPPYRYPKITDAYLLEHFNMIRIKGYYGEREFYQPIYDKIESKVISGDLDYRNTLLWNPQVITNSSGEATIQFYCSDIKTRYLGTIEGVGEGGLLGREVFDVFVE